MPLRFPEHKRARRFTFLLVVLLASLSAARCTFARWPVDGTLTSPFGIRFRGLLPQVHRGVDIRVPSGTDVFAMLPGRVLHAGPLGDYGLTVILDHGRRTRSLYGHLSSIAVRAGAQVDGGSLIGRSGQSGNASGPHLHFEIQRYGHPEDPVPLLGRRPRETPRADTP